MAGESKGGSGGGSGGVLLIGLFLIPFLFWLVSGKQISTALVHLRMMELAPIALVSDGAASTRHSLGLVHPEYLSFKNLWFVVNDSGKYLRWVLSPAILVMAIVLFRRRDRFKRKFKTARELALSQVGLWPAMGPAFMQDLLKADIHKGPWAVPMNPREFVAHHKLLNEGGVLDYVAANATFSAQLGAPWQGAKRLPLHARAVFAILCLRLAGTIEKDEWGKERFVAYRRAGELSTVFCKKGLKGFASLGWIDEAIEAHGSHQYVKEATQRHAFVFTVIATILQVVRAEGVLTSGEFGWLYPVDRRLFFTLDAVGRYAFFPEVAGIMSHWLAEKTVNERLLSPNVRGAVENLETALSEIKDDDVVKRLFL
jgi:intracellular multiplication protein IcmP